MIMFQAHARMNIGTNRMIAQPRFIQSTILAQLTGKDAIARKIGC